jgi:hypothetical protein
MFRSLEFFKFKNFPNPRTVQILKIFKSEIFSDMENVISATATTQENNSFPLVCSWESGMIKLAS